LPITSPALIPVPLTSVPLSVSLEEFVLDSISELGSASELEPGSELALELLELLTLFLLLELLLLEESHPASILANRARAISEVKIRTFLFIRTTFFSEIFAAA